MTAMAFNGVMHLRDNIEFLPMKDENILESQTNAAGDIAGVYEHDEDVGYFYLYDICNDDSQRVRAAVHVANGPSAHSAEAVSIRWSINEKYVGLFIQGYLRAAFDAETGASFRPGTSNEASIAESVLRAFAGG